MLCADNAAHFQANSLFINTSALFLDENTVEPRYKGRRRGIRHFVLVVPLENFMSISKNGRGASMRKRNFVVVFLESFIMRS